ncbi:methyltransferase domain-containing protein [Gilvimarinus xylanilyticus]|uniref:Class I SAM-dependent methyltransferase n=1 Tax=Gilvimarinus xylanilyticus TaxID=2944139 RepID=A0A9X2HUM8_9GAMM|nr:methyltransferase domain-containing protein [Gilvimarinus xylanilyticus]MCP8898525.1 class I SAM-dependent methyltransferase [Gilvimarinus xylanilyticus]
MARDKVVSPPLAVQALSAWFDQPAGGALLERQQAQVARALSCLFGYHLCQLSVCKDVNLTADSRIPHKFALGPTAQAGGREAGCVDLTRLPLASESVDVMVLHHALDYSATPHQLLAEAARATIPRGHILMVGFNPWSPVGAWHGVRRLIGGGPLWRHHQLRLARLLDWCTVLGLEPVSVEYGGFWPGASKKPGQVAESIGTAVRLPWGSYYVALVRKDVPGVIPIKPPWESGEVVGLKPLAGKLTGRQAPNRRYDLRRDSSPKPK